MRVQFFARVYSKSGKVLGVTPVCFTARRSRAAKTKRRTTSTSGYNAYSCLVEQGKVKRDRYGRFIGF